MADYEVGYGKPPKHTQFKKGVCPNPKGRGKRPKMQMDDLVEKVLNAAVEYREGGKRKRQSRVAVVIRQLAISALGGDLESAASLLRLRAQAVKHGGKTADVIYVHNALPMPPAYKPPGGRR